jgi:ParB family transcriptional regulator, chromosome partitioning protein
MSSVSHPASTLPTAELQPNPFQPRGMMDNEDILELKQSIATYGILEPLVVAQTPAGYQIIAGERRWRAARELGLAEVPVVIKKNTPRGMLEMAIVENVQRVDLSAIERAQAFQQLVRDFNFTLNDISDKVGKSLSYVSNTVKLLELPDAIKDGLVGGMISEGHARALQGIRDEKTMIECYKMILKEHASVRRAEELVRRFKDQIGESFGGRGRSTKSHTPETHEWVNNLQTALPGKTKIKLSRSSRQTRVSFVFQGSVKQTQEHLEKLLKLTKM